MRYTYRDIGYSRKDSMIYELRSYFMLPGKLAEFLEAFDRIPRKVLARHGAELVGFWTTVIGQNNEVVYMLRYSDLAARERTWTAVDHDEEMAQYRAEPVRVQYIVSKILRPSAFSPLK